ncbi:type II toxin-antitoxin system RelE/ParE family toxin [Nereida sp. NH-UV-3]|uniref:type II toxin-antitoxin system RelE/ParE family toxin n=1 Tax=Nereida TaxID=282198 RepID=UPI0036F2B72F
MSAVQFTNAARKDLREIFTYTTRTWGIAQARQYSEQLKQHTIAIGEFRAHSKTVLGSSSDVHQSHCRKHIFVFERRGDKVLIVRILHEAMDIPHHLKLDN